MREKRTNCQEQSVMSLQKKIVRRVKLKNTVQSSMRDSDIALESLLLTYNFGPHNLFKV